MSGYENDNVEEQQRRQRQLLMVVSDKILTLLDDQAMGNFAEMDRGDVQGVTEATAAMVIKLVQDSRLSEVGRMLDEDYDHEDIRAYLREAQS